MENHYPRVSWNFNTEVDILGYDIYRDAGLGQGFEKLTRVNSSTNYYVDHGIYVLSPNKYSPLATYYVKAVNEYLLESSASDRVWVRYDGVESKKLGISGKPERFEMKPNFPNPFNPTTSIEFNLPTDAFVSMKVYNTLGQQISVLVFEPKSAGIHKVEFNGSSLPSGMYYCTLIADNFTTTRKILLTR